MRSFAAVAARHRRSPAKSGFLTPPPKTHFFLFLPHFQSLAGKHLEIASQ
jgi:hypothetical protein